MNIQKQIYYLGKTVCEYYAFNLINIISVIRNAKTSLLNKQLDKYNFDDTTS